MADKIDMSLDDIIKKTKGNRKLGQGRRKSGPGGSGGPGKRRSFSAGGGNRRRSFGGGQPKRRSLETGNRRRSDGGPRRGGIAQESGPTKLIVSNLDFGVTDSDIKELFSEFGRLKSAAVHYDRSGRSLGTADVFYEKRGDAVKAMKTYNGVPLDKREMKIQVATSEVSVISPRPKFAPRNNGGRVEKSPRNQRRRSGGPAGQNGGAGKPGKSKPKTKRAPPPSKEDLDKELDSYLQSR